MSGPKISVYSLDSRGKKLVFGQLRCEQQSVLCAQQIQNLLHQVLSYGGELQKQMTLMQILERRNESAAEKREVFSNLLQRMQSDTERIRTALRENMPHLSAKYEISEEALENKKQELAKLRAMKKEVEALRSEIESVTASEVEGKNAALTIIQHGIEADVGGYVSFAIPVEDETPEPGFEEEKAVLQNKITALLRDNALPAELRNEITRVANSLERIHQPEYLHSFEAVSVKNLYAKYAVYQQSKKQKQEAFAESYARYKMLCETMRETEKPIHLFADAAEVDSEIERLEMAAVKMQEQSYISECVDQVMSEMGYDLIGTREVVKRRTGKTFRNELYTYHEGTAVNVTYASDGQISMELGGISRVDRIPSQEETELLTRDMESFCGEFTEFECRLKDKGVIVNHRIALSPPTAEYATIINVADYDVEGGTQITEMESAEHRKKSVEKKVIRRME